MLLVPGGFSQGHWLQNYSARHDCRGSSSAHHFSIISGGSYAGRFDHGDYLRLHHSSEHWLAVERGHFTALHLRVTSTSSNGSTWHRMPEPKVRHISFNVSQIYFGVQSQDGHFRQHRHLRQLQIPSSWHQLLPRTRRNVYDDVYGGTNCPEVQGVHEAGKNFRGRILWKARLCRCASLPDNRHARNGGTESNSNQSLNF